MRDEKPATATDPVLAVTGDKGALLSQGVAPSQGAKKLDAAKPTAKKNAAKKRAFAAKIKDVLTNLFAYPVNIRVGAFVRGLSRGPRWVSIDSMATDSFTHNRVLLSDVRRIHFFITGVNGTQDGAEIGSLPGFGDCYVTLQSGATGLVLAAAEAPLRAQMVREPRQQESVGLST